jgi:hypothetical protein
LGTQFNPEKNLRMNLGHSNVEVIDASRINKKTEDEGGGESRREDGHCQGLRGQVRGG